MSDPGLRVLAVDDENDALELLHYLLTRHGAEVRAETSVAGAMATLRSWRPDVIVSDIAMPGEDGFSFMERVRRLAPERGGRVPAAMQGRSFRALITAPDSFAGDSLGRGAFGCGQHLRSSRRLQRPRR